MKLALLGFSWLKLEFVKDYIGRFEVRAAGDF